MPGRQVVWTHEKRKIVFAKLAEQFGPYREWGRTAFPKDRKAEYNAVLQELADILNQQFGTNLEWTAVEQQVKWGYTDQNGPRNRSHVRNYILNKAAALESGFISSNDLPATLSAE